jgi:cell division protein FtsI (penicillin-binding protein 3)
LAQPKKWSGVSTAYIAHGYEVQVTPLHILMFYNAIANNGVMVKPRIIEKVKEYNTTIDSFVTVTLNERVMNESTIRQLREILVGVVENGTANNLKTDYLQVAGKTGTAVIAQGKQGYKNGGNKIYQASFCGYFPANNPQYSMIVVVNSPGTNGYYGNVVAGTIFKEVADKVYSLSLNMHKSVNKDVVVQNKVPAIQNGNSKAMKAIYEFLGVKVDAPATEWANTTTQGGKIVLTEKEMQAGVVPDVTGMGLKDALYLLESMGMKVTVSGKGNVRRQSVSPGEKLRKGMPVVIELS